MPLAISNWGAAYRLQGILAPGKDILGAVPGGGTGTKSGTSFATAIVSGTAALLLSIQLAAGEKADPQVVRRALIASATPCNISDADNIRCLAGRLNPRGALELIIRGGMQMTNLNFSTNGASLGVAPAEAPALEQIPPEPTPIGSTCHRFKPTAIGKRRHSLGLRLRRGRGRVLVRAEIGCRADRLCTRNNRLRFRHRSAPRFVCASDARHVQSVRPGAAGRLYRR
jgi:hypothetical protein